jgi:DNA modification methylase
MAEHMRGFQRWCEIWAAEVYRVLKPGGHILAFGGTRTYHRMVVAIEDAGFEIRDTITWHYGSGFPKNLDVSKSIDKAAEVEREMLGMVDPRSSFDGRQRASSAINTNWRSAEDRADVVDLSQKVVTAPATDAAKQWSGWGTALKPATELIALARKPLSEGTVAANVLKHGTGAINIDGCRIGYEPKDAASVAAKVSKNPTGRAGLFGVPGIASFSSAGRWPANAIFDEAAGALLDEQSGVTSVTGTRSTVSKNAEVAGTNWGTTNHRSTEYPGDSGGASRFFYCAKASQKERGEGNNHPTIKPIKLMEYLVRLITPPGGVVLDPFSGSGTTLLACQGLGYHHIGFEKDPGYFAIAQKRIAGHKPQLSLTA